MMNGPSSSASTVSQKCRVSIVVTSGRGGPRWPWLLLRGQPLCCSRVPRRRRPAGLRWRSCWAIAARRNGSPGVHARRNRPGRYGEQKSVGRFRDAVGRSSVAFRGLVGGGGRRREGWVGFSRWWAGARGGRRELTSCSFCVGVNFMRKIEVFVQCVLVVPGRHWRRMRCGRGAIGKRD